MRSRVVKVLPCSSIRCTTATHLYRLTHALSHVDPYGGRPGDRDRLQQQRCRQPERQRRRNLNLRTLNGQTLPVALGSGAVLDAEQLRLNNDGSYSDIASYSDGTSFTEVGFYDINNNLITFQDQTDGISYTGSVSGDVLTESNNGFVGVYQRN